MSLQNLKIAGQRNENNIRDINDIKKFNRLNFSYAEKLSEENKFVFLKEENDVRGRN